MTKYQVLLNEETHSPERGEKEILILREFNSFLSIIKLHKKNFIYILGHLGGSPFKTLYKFINCKHQRNERPYRLNLLQHTKTISTNFLTD